MANLFLRFPGGKIKTLTLSYDDGVEQDEKLVDIMVKYGLKGTFNLNSGVYAAEGTVYPAGQIHRRMPKSRIDKLYVQNGMEVAVHGYTHPFLEQLPINRATYEVLQDRMTLERQFNQIIRGMAYPYGTYNDEVVDALKACGIAYCRTIISSENFDLPKDWLRLEATCHHDNPRLMELADKFVNTCHPCGCPWMFYLWGHSYEFEEHNNWNVIEEFAKKVSGKDDIWYATNIEVFDYVHAFNELRFNTDMTFCYNPTATDLWFEYNETPYFVKAGESIQL